MRKLVTLLFAISACEVIAQNLFTPVFSSYVGGVGGNLEQAGLAMAIQSIMIGLLTVFFGRVATKYHSERLQVTLGFLLLAGTYFSYALIRTPGELYLAEAVAGLAIAISAPAFSGLYSAAMEDGKHSSGWGDFMGTMYIIAALSLLLAGVISQRAGFPTLFASMGAVQLVGAALSFKIYLDDRA